jgi:hypothetical protein
MQSPVMKTKAAAVATAPIMAPSISRLTATCGEAPQMSLAASLFLGPVGMAAFLLVGAYIPTSTARQAQTDGVDGPCDGIDVPGWSLVMTLSRGAVQKARRKVTAARVELAKAEQGVSTYLASLCSSSTT